MWSLLALVACRPVDDTPCLADGEPHLVVATTDLETGALAAMSLDGTCVEDQRSTTSGDPLVRALGDRVVAADRTGGDAVRVFAAGAYGTPLAEFAVGRGSNVHDVARDGERLIVAPYDEDALVVTDLDGAGAIRVDLSPLADADGLPEPDRLVWVDGALWASLQLLDRADGYRPTGPGLLVEVDVSGARTGAVHELGTDPKVLPDPTDPAAATVATGRFYVPDGEVGTWDGAFHPLTDEASLGFDATHVLALVDGTTVVVGVDFDVGGPSHVACLAPDGTTSAATDAGFLADAVSDGVSVWLADRLSWNGGGSGAVLALDPVACELSVLADGFLLDPYALALVETSSDAGG